MYREGCPGVKFIDYQDMSDILDYLALKQFDIVDGLRTSL